MYTKSNLKNMYIKKQATSNNAGMIKQALLLEGGKRTTTFLFGFLSFFVATSVAVVFTPSAQGTGATTEKLDA